MLLWCFWILNGLQYFPVCSSYLAISYYMIQYLYNITYDFRNVVHESFGAQLWCFHAHYELLFYVKSAT